MHDENGVGSSDLDAGDFGPRVRQLTLDAHQILNRPDSPLDDLIGLHRRVFCLLDEARGVRSSAIRRWLLAVRREIGVRFERWSVEDLESLVA